MKPTVRRAVERQDRNNICAKPQVEGVSEADQSAVSEQQIEAEGGEPEYQDPQQERNVKWCIDRFGKQWHEAEQQDQQGDRHDAG